MRTEIIMTPQELEDIKSKLVSTIIKNMLTGKIHLEIEKDIYNKDYYKINGNIYNDDIYHTIKINDIFIDINELPPSVKELLKDTTFSEYDSYKITDIKLEKDNIYG